MPDNGPFTRRRIRHGNAELGILSYLVLHGASVGSIVVRNLACTESAGYKALRRLMLRGLTTLITDPTDENPVSVAGERIRRQLYVLTTDGWTEAEVLLANSPTFSWTRAHVAARNRHTSTAAKSVPGTADLLTGVSGE